MHQFSPPVGRGNGLVQHGHGFRRFGQTIDRQFQVAQHDRQNIVEIMGYAARQLSHGFYLLRLMELLFRRNCIVDIIYQKYQAAIWQAPVYPLMPAAKTLEPPIIVGLLILPHAIGNPCLLPANGGFHDPRRGYFAVKVL